MPKNKSAESILHSFSSVALPEASRIRMRAELGAYADLHSIASVPARVAVRSPFYTMRLWYGVTAFVMVILVGTSGAAFASGSTLPGDILYPIKISIAEPVQGALITAPEAKAKWHASLAERRLEEATTLAVANKLDSSKQTFLADQFSKQVTTSGSIADALKSSGQSETSLALRSDLEARLTAHADILGLVVDHLTASASTTPDVAVQTRALLVAVRDREHAVTEARVALEQDANTTATSSARTIAIATQSAHDNIARISAHNTGATLLKTSPVAPTVEKDMNTAQNALTDVHDQIATAQPRAAARQAGEAARASEVASIVLEHEGLLKSLGITATSTASTTVTASTTPASAPKALPAETIKKAPETGK